MTLYIKDDGSEVRYETLDGADSYKGASRIWPDEDGLPALHDWRDAEARFDTSVVSIAWAGVRLTGDSFGRTAFLPLSGDNGPEFGW